MVKGRVRSRGDARFKMLSRVFSPRVFFRGRRRFGGTVVGNKFASYTRNRQSGKPCFSPLAPHPHFQGRNAFLDFLFSVPWLPGFHFTCELISVACLSGVIFPNFLILFFGLLTRILDPAFAAPPTHTGEDSTSRAALGTIFRATFFNQTPPARAQPRHPALGAMGCPGWAWVGGVNSEG